MKLYTTVSGAKKLPDSNKYIMVNKGQGSNTLLNLALHIDDEKNPRYRIHMTVRENNSTDVVFVDMSKPFPNQVIYEETIVNYICKHKQPKDCCATCKWIESKGEKKKDECDGKHESVQAIIDCKTCSETLDRM